MRKQHNFDFATSSLSEDSFQEILDFIYELDQFAANFSFGLAGPGLLDSVLQQLLDGEANGRLMLKKFQDEVVRVQVDGYSMTHEEGFKLMMLTILASLHFAVHALQAESVDEALRHFARAERLRGFADGLLFSGTDALVRANLARMGAKAKNKETEQIRNRLEAWYAQHHTQFKSMDAAAEAARKQEPISFRTARQWLSEYKKRKKLQ
ncbi:hypothetical protein NX786_20270 [Telluria mixta]|uniref:Uncharacterized protein n=1 Tax=Telluria mixta TaxID=34071 RepID=A0ABT2C4B6_9BURK|nr:hypothetical protein [Telluria mixta]MCS0631666.1 hypothetical protein [Telluria mixta]WEM98416.1 hypothetical protein P0M04_12120 [Telluria mixta]